MFSTIAYPMVGDSLDYLEWKTGERLEGFCFSLNSSVTKFNNAFAAITVSVFLVLIQFKQPVEDAMGVVVQQAQTAQTLDGIFALVTLLPAGGFALAIVPMLFYRYTGKRKEQILQELKERRGEQKETATSNV